MSKQESLFDEQGRCRLCDPFYTGVEKDQPRALTPTERSEIWPGITKEESRLRAALAGWLPATHPAWDRLERLVEDALEAVRAEEREACAKIADKMDNPGWRAPIGEVAKAIRARNTGLVTSSDE